MRPIFIRAHNYATLKDNYQYFLKKKLQHIIKKKTKPQQQSSDGLFFFFFFFFVIKSLKILWICLRVEDFWWDNNFLIGVRCCS